MKQEERRVTDSLKTAFSLPDWLEAEEESKNNEPQPEGSITVEQYAELRGCSVIRARVILSELRQKGLARSEKWATGRSGTRNVYWLKPKKEWPKK